MVPAADAVDLKGWPISVQFIRRSGNVRFDRAIRASHRTSSMELIMKRSRRVVLMMMGAAAVTSALPAAALAIPREADPRLLRNTNPDPAPEKHAQTYGLPGNRFEHRLRAGG